VDAGGAGAVVGCDAVDVVAISGDDEVDAGAEGDDAAVVDGFVGGGDLLGLVVGEGGFDAGLSCAVGSHAAGDAGGVGEGGVASGAGAGPLRHTHRLPRDVRYHKAAFGTIAPMTTKPLPDEMSARDARTNLTEVLNTVRLQDRRIRISVRGIHHATIYPAAFDDLVDELGGLKEAAAVMRGVIGSLDA
jgi:hypothetical protein